MSLAVCGIGTYWLTYVEDGDKSYLSHHAVSISKFSVHLGLLSGSTSVSGQTFRSPFIMTSIRRILLVYTMKTMSSPHWNTPVVYVTSGLPHPCGRKRWPRRCRSHFPP